MSGVNEIRRKFLDYFKSQGHEVVASSPLVPRNDPTLMFTNAGMVQFKNVFTGLEKRPYTQAATAQKCVRAGGKHNDLDNVGYTARHHTFFEMLGNFSFGDYFKDRAIELAWNLITKDFGLPKDRLVVTVYIDDDQAFKLWKKIAGLPDEKIIRIAGSDNFWQMGDLGPCGPCSEIFYDHGPHIPGGPPGSPDADGDRFIEIWNLVFMQFEQQAGGARTALPKPSIDTGMGLERIAAVLQGTHDNYKIDLFSAIIGQVADLTGVDPDGAQKASHRVIADHLRASSFLIADGVLPSNEGRGYVLRRIMRRAMRHAELLGARDPLMFKLVPTLIREMGQAYPELIRAEARISETIRHEENRFRVALSKGLALLRNATEEFGKPVMNLQGEPVPGTEKKVLPGHVAFRLEATYGMPLDLTQDALRSMGWTVDLDGYYQEKERDRELARKSWKGSGEAVTEAVWFPLREKFGATEFLGYDTESSEGVVQTIVRGGPEVTELQVGEGGQVILNQTPFYAESGGQVGDTGWMRRISDGAIVARVLDTQKKVGDLIVHHVAVENQGLKVGEALRLDVDRRRRGDIRRNHSATHLLHEALRQVLGDHVAQRGSLVAPDKLRFDFLHPKPISETELERVEDIANEIVIQNSPVVTQLMGVDDAIDSGARALFGEKYGDEVRVVSMGETPTGTNAMGWSVELCGGTHVERTGDIGLISIVGESGVASGVRRIEALTGAAARKNANTFIATANSVASVLHAPLAELAERASALLDERKKLERELSDVKKRLIMSSPALEAGDATMSGSAGMEVSGSGQLEAGNATMSGVVKVSPIVARVLNNIDAKELRPLVDDYKKRLGSGVVILVATNDGKASVAVGVVGKYSEANNAVDVVKAGAAILGGKGGGGRPDLALAGGPEIGKAQEALDAMRKMVRDPEGS